MSLGAVVVAYGAYDLLQRCVGGLLEAGVQRIVIWDNLNDRTASEWPASLKDARITITGSGKNVGFGRGVNQAVSILRDCDQILIVNPDCIVSRACVSSLVATAQNSSIGLVAPLMRYPDGGYGIAGGPKPSLIKELAALTRIDDFLPKGLRSKALMWFGKRRGLGTYGESQTPGATLDVEWVSAFCVLVRMDVFDAVGGFDEAFFLYFEDVDLSLRVRAYGLRAVIDRGVEALHYESVTTSARGKGRHYWSGFRRFVAKHGSPMEKLLVYPRPRMASR